MLDTIFGALPGPQVRVTLAMLNMTSSALYRLTHDFELRKCVRPINGRNIANLLVECRFYGMLTPSLAIDFLDSLPTEVVYRLLTQPSKSYCDRQRIANSLVATGDLTMIKSIISMGYRIERKPLAKIAASGDYIKLVHVLSHYTNKHDYHWSILNGALKSNNLECIKAVHDKFFVHPTYPAPRGKDFDMSSDAECIRFAVERCNIQWEEVYSLPAVESGNVVALQLISELGFALPGHAWIRAAKYGHLEVLKYLHHIGVPVPAALKAYPLGAAIEGGHRSCFDYLMGIHPPFDALSVACSCRKMEFVQLLAPRSDAPPDVIEQSRCIDLDILKYLRSFINPDGSHKFLMEASDTLSCILDNGGTADTFAWVCTHLGYKPKSDDTYFLNQALRKGMLEIAAICLGAGAKLDHRSCLSAVYGGNYHCLQFAHENGASWDEQVCFRSAYFGNVDCLRYAHEHGCPWNGEIYEICTSRAYCEQDIQEGRYKCFTYAIEQGCPFLRDKLYRFRSFE